MGIKMDKVCRWAKMAWELAWHPNRRKNYKLFGLGRNQFANANWFAPPFIYASESVFCCRKQLEAETVSSNMVYRAVAVACSFCLSFNFLLQQAAGLQGPFHPKWGTVSRIVWILILLAIWAKLSTLNA